MPIGLTAADFFPLRARNLYDPANINGTAPNVQAEDPTDDIASLIGKMYQPEHAIADQYSSMLGQMPQREQPSKLRMIGSVLAGLGAGAGPAAYHGGAALGFQGNPQKAMEVSDQFANLPYYNKLADFNARVGVLGKGAAEEEKRNVNARSTAEQTAGKVLQERGQANTLRHQLETEHIAKEKSDQQYEVKISGLEQKATEATNKLNFAMDEAQRKQGNAEAIQKLNEAKFNAEKAKWDLDRAQKDRALEEQKNLHATMASKWEAEKADREKKIAQYEKQLGINQQKADKPSGTQPSTTIRETKDASGKVTGTTTTTRSTGAQKAPEIGDVKTFPNGKKGKFDGKGWVMINE